ncbi:uncharacterized protein LOC131696159 [Topomyia yanbarensis]|uniref:uncharacterized protein LOC131696159 n=1 Tax=Topomyia yanbarensis TaxID=2498891 RepID=UPI00273A9A83|nr:uncharacterized protein LOC131696159 [Topomyia yanbarensis]
MEKVVERLRGKMSRRINLIGVCAVSGLCILLLFASHRFTSNSYATEYFKPRERNANLRLLNAHKFYGTKSFSAGSSYDTNPAIPTPQNSTITIEDILSYQRSRIADEMIEFQYPNGLYDNGATKLSDLTPETNGQPVRSIIVTTWRSGSTFLGDILNAMPGNYYHYEPLLDFDIIQIRGPPNDRIAIHNLKQLLKCDYTEMDSYLEFGKTHNYLFSHNTRLWRHCRLFPQFCYEPKFLGPFCKLFPLQSMKVVRLRASLVTPLLEDER